MDNKLMKIEELMEYTRLKRQTVYNYTHMKKIPYLKVGGLRFIKNEIDEWLARGSTMKAACDIMIKAGRSHMVDLRLLAVLNKRQI